jgi:2-polyprenyl-6-methoxyphenol hydroxylase-like FAD-dependent oxidoreductase
MEIRADLTVGADGRHSTVRKQAGLEVIDLGAPIDVLWMRIPREKTDPEQTLGRFQAGKILVMLNRGDYWQCAYVIAKGTFDEMKRAACRPSQGPLRAGSVSWQSIETLKIGATSACSVSVDRLRLVANRSSCIETCARHVSVEASASI